LKDSKISWEGREGISYRGDEKGTRQSKKGKRISSK